MNTQPRTSTTAEVVTEAQQLTTISPTPNLDPLGTSNGPTFQELLAKYNITISGPEVTWDRLIASYNPVENLNESLVPSLPHSEFSVASPLDISSDEPASPFAIYQNNLSNASPQAVRWLWQNRLPLSGITLLDGDHGCGKSLLALQIAAHVSSGTPMPDGTSTLQGGVVLITPHVDANTTQLQRLTALGADLSRIQILSYIQEPETSSHSSGCRPFSLPQDLPRLFEAVERVNARLIILDPFIDLLSLDQRWTDQRLAHLLADLNQHLIARQIACLLIRACPAEGGHARPCVLERSERFLRLATSRLLLAPDPIHPDHLLLSHATSRHAALTPTLTLQICPSPDNPDLPHISLLGSHSLQARDLISFRPTALHRQLLSRHLLQIITEATDPIPVVTLYARFPHSSAFQIQPALSDLLHMGQIQRTARGLYTIAPATPEHADELESSAARTLTPEEGKQLESSAATTPIAEAANELKSTAATTPTPEAAKELKSAAARTLKPKTTKRPHKGRNRHKNTKNKRKR